MKFGNKVLFRALSLLIVCALVLPVAGCKGKQDASLKRKCEGAVEDYFEYLKRGKNDKCSRYIDPDEDPFQQLDDSADSQVFMVFQKTLTYEIDEAELDGNDAIVKVYMTVRDGSDVVRTLGTNPTIEDVQASVDKISAVVNKTVEVELTYDKSTKNYQILSSEDIYSSIDKQASKIYGKIGYTSPDDCKEQVDELAKAFSIFDLNYINAHTNLELDGDYDKNLMPLYQAEMSTLLRSYTLKSIDENKAEVYLHFEKYDGEEAYEKIMNDKEVLAKLLSKFVVALAEDKNVSLSDNLMSYLAFGDIVDDFRTELAKTTKVKIDVSCTITYDDHNEPYFEFERDLDALFPPEDGLDYVGDFTDAQQCEIYLRASDIAYEKDDLTKEQYDILTKTFSPYPLSDEEIKTIMEKYGYKIQTNTSASTGNLDFENGSNAMATIELRSGFDDAYEEMQEMVVDLKNMVRSGEITANIDGVTLDMMIDATVNGQKMKVYACVIQSRIYSFSLVVDDSTQTLEEWEAMLRELKLIA